MSPYLVTNTESMLVELMNLIFCSREKISAINDFIPLEKWSTGKPLLIIAEDIEGSPGHHRGQQSKRT